MLNVAASIFFKRNTQSFVSMDYSYYQSAAGSGQSAVQQVPVVQQQQQQSSQQQQPTTTGMSQFSDYDQQIINNAANSLAAAEYVKSATRSLYTQPMGSMLTPPPPPPPPLNATLYTSHTNLATGAPVSSLASSQYLKLAQPLNSGASTAPPLSILHPSHHQHLNYITYNLDDLKLANGGGHAMSTASSGAGGSTVVAPQPVHVNASNGGTGVVYSSLGNLVHSGTRSTPTTNLINF